MPVRSFVDADGTQWRVWATIPTGVTVLSSGFDKGWLTFESEKSLRRLTPIPRDWEEASHSRLDLMCRAAMTVPRRTQLSSPKTFVSDEVDGRGER
jgi:hypothetical protein